MSEENRSAWIHKENQDEWRFVGIWADMLDENFLQEENVKPKDFLILFREFNSPLDAVKENLRLRNLYNQYKSLKKKEELQKMEDDIKKQISALADRTELSGYTRKDNELITVALPASVHSSDLML